MSTATQPRSAAASMIGSRVAAIAATLARVILGALWLGEGILKLRAGFGQSDILIVVGSTAKNSRVPEFYKFFTANALGGAPDLFGFGVPLVEVGLGIALILGVLTLPAALGSVAVLCSYWFADQLILQYPIMIALSTVVAAFSAAATRYSLTSLVIGRSRRSVGPGVRRWL